MSRRRTALVALGASLALVLAACGSSSKGKTTGGTPSSGGSAASSAGSSAGNNANAAEGFTANSITIEGDVDKTSGSGQSEALAELGAKARFNRANQEGGDEPKRSHVDRQQRGRNEHRDEGQDRN